VKVDLPPRQEVLPGDENYVGEWNGADYDLRRRRDGIVVGTAATKAALERLLAQQYPQRGGR